MINVFKGERFIMQEASTSQAASPAESPLKVHNFRLLWIGEGISVLGDNFYLIALPWLVLQLTGSALALGTVLALASIPRALFMLIGGALVDRFSPRAVMFVSNLVRMILVGVLAVLVFTESIQLWMLYVFALAFGLADAFFFPAESSMLPKILKSEQLQAGNAIAQGTATIGMFLGPVLAGVLIAVFGSVSSDPNAPPDMRGIAAAFAIDSISFLASITALALMRLESHHRDESAQNVLAAIGEGIAYVRGNTVLRTVFILIVALNLLIIGPFSVGLPVLVDRNLSADAAAFGIIMSAQGAGMIIGVILAGMLPKPSPTLFGPITLGVLALLGIETILLPLFNVTLIVAVIALVMGITTGYVHIGFMTWLQKRTPQDMMGRIMSLIMFASFGVAPVSSAVAGVIIESNLTALFIGAGVLLTIITLAATTAKSVREMGLEVPANGQPPMTLSDALRSTSELPAVLRTTGTMPIVKL